MLKLTGFLPLFFFLIISSTFGKGQAEYSEATDVFELIDNVSKWSPKSINIYREVWEKKFPFTLEDKSDFAFYANLREKYRTFWERENPKPKEESKIENVFGKQDVPLDNFSEAFYSSKTIGEALRKLEKGGVTPKDVKFLATFYRKYKDKISHFLKESTHFSVRLLEINNHMKKTKVNYVLHKLVPFVLGKDNRKFRLHWRPVWWPKGSLPQIDIRGNYLLLRINPLEKGKLIPFEDMGRMAAEALLQAQPINQQKNISKIFSFNCRGRETELRESLKILFSEVVPQYVTKKKSFDLYKNWSRSVFIDVFVRLLFPLYQQEIKNSKDTFAGTFMDQAILLCRKINKLSIAP